MRPASILASVQGATGDLADIVARVVIRMRMLHPQGTGVMLAKGAVNRDEI